jgi:hypothetical protein
MSTLPDYADPPFACPPEKRPANFIDLSGQRFGQITVHHFLGKGQSPNGHTYSNWWCVCDCGTGTIVRTGSLRSGHTVSCGCEKTRKTIEKNHRHGLANKVPEYSIWKGMKSRCQNPKNQDYAYYGARGIFVCDRWKNDFAAFFADMGPRPSAKHTIERENVNGNYEPSNCVWLPAHLQSANRRCAGGNFR